MYLILKRIIFAQKFTTKTKVQNLNQLTKNMKKLLRKAVTAISAAMIVAGLMLQSANYINGSAIFTTGIIIMAVIAMGEIQRDYKENF